EIIKSFHIENELWRELSEPFLTSIDPSLSIIDPMILPLNIGQRNGQQNNDQATIVAYDSYGLSVYGRLGLFLIELIHKIGVVSFFFGSDNKIDTQNDTSYSNCNRILLELLLLSVLCTDIRRSRKSDHHLWDAFNVEESDYRGFKAFLVDARLIVKNYTLQMLQNGQLDVEFILNNLNSTMISHNVQHNGISGLLCEAVKRSHGEKVVAAASISLKQAEEFLDVIKSEHNPNVWSMPTSSSIHILIAKLLHSLVTTVQELCGNHWSFIFELLQYWLQIFSYQYCAYLEILCEACHDLPKEILVHKKDELYALLLIPHEGIQKCAYKLAHILVNEKVLSEGFELLGTPDLALEGLKPHAYTNQGKGPLPGG
ncbi:9069_t:CDS:2, partial [Racocetra fulgida]